MFGGDLIAGLTVFGMTWTLVQAYRASLSHQRVMRILQLKSESSARLLERAGSDPHLVDLLKSDAQQHLFDVRIDDASPRVPAMFDRVVTSLQISVVLLPLGVAFLILAHGRSDAKDHDLLVFFGTMGLALGVGALLSGAAAFIASRAWQPRAHESA